MTDGLDQALVQAGLDLLGADPQLTVYDGNASGATPPYVLVYAYVDRPMDRPDNPLDGRSATFLARWYCHCVGATASAARAVAQRVRTALLDVRPTVVGLQCGLIRQEDANPPTRDDSTGSPVFDAVLVYQVAAS